MTGREDYFFNKLGKYVELPSVYPACMHGMIRYCSLTFPMVKVKVTVEGRLC